MDDKIQNTGNGQMAPEKGRANPNEGRTEHPRESLRSRIESMRKSMQLTPSEAEALLKDMKESSEWIKQELARRR